MADAAGVAREFNRREPAQFRKRGRTQRSGILLAVVFCIG